MRLGNGLKDGHMSNAKRDILHTSWIIVSGAICVAFTQLRELAEHVTEEKDERDVTGDGQPRHYLSVHLGQPRKLKHGMSSDPPY